MSERSKSAADLKHEPLPDGPLPDGHFQIENFNTMIALPCMHRSQLSLQNFAMKNPIVSDMLHGSKRCTRSACAGKSHSS